MKDKIIATYSVSHETAEQLERYVTELLKWNKKINLIGKSTEVDIWQRHIADAAQLISYLPANTKQITDFGAGAGIPGIILAIMTEAHVDLIESDSRKSAFMNHIIAELALDATVHNVRIESLDAWENNVVTARAFAPLPVILDIGKDFLQKTQICLFLKGQNVVEEIEGATKYWEFQAETYPSQVEGNGVVLKIKDVREIN